MKISFSIILKLTIVSIAIFLGIVAVYLYTLPELPTPQYPTLTMNQKSIYFGTKEVLNVNHPEIVQWFRTESDLCGEYALSSIKERKGFCEDPVQFTNLTRFRPFVSWNKDTLIGFTIESDVLSPDTAVGIFSLQSNTVKIITNYYLGNSFIAFSPDGKAFVYKENCFEAKCGLTVRNSETLAITASVNNPEFLDMRDKDVNFLRWLSNTEIEYTLGDDIMQQQI